MSYQELYQRYRQAKQGMFEARNPEERQLWLEMYHWTLQEIRSLNAANAQLPM
jgi:hypothetical protein